MTVIMVAVSMPPLTRSPSPLGVEAVAQFLERVSDAAPDIRVLSMTFDELMVASRGAADPAFFPRGAGDPAFIPRRGVPNASSGVDSPRMWDPSADGADGCVIVPLALSCTPRDSAALLAAARMISAVTPSVVAQPWGPDARVVDALIDRLLGVGLRASDRVVLECGDASDSRTVAEAVAAGDKLSSSLGIDVAVGFRSISALGALDAPPSRPVEPAITEEPSSTEDAIARERAAAPCSRVVVSSYALAADADPGAAASAAERVTPPLLVPYERPPQSLIALLLERFREASGQLENATLETMVSEPPLGLA